MMKFSTVEDICGKMSKDITSAISELLISPDIISIRKK